MLKKKREKKSIKWACKSTDVTIYVKVAARRAYRHVDEEFTSLQSNSQTGDTLTLGPYILHPYVTQQTSLCYKLEFFFFLH